VGVPFQRDASFIEILSSVKKRMEEGGTVMDPDKVFGGGVKNVLWLTWAQHRHPLVWAAFVQGVAVGDLRLYGKAWAPVLEYLLKLGLLSAEHTVRYREYASRVSAKI